MLFHSCVLELIHSSMLPIIPYWGHEMCYKIKRNILGQQKNWSQDLRRGLKQNLLKTRRKLWPAAARDCVYLYPYSCHTSFSWFFPFLMSGEDSAINACWSSTRRTWLLYYYALEFPRKSFCSHQMLGVPSFHWLVTYSVFCWHTCTSE